jgi:hypothetical protein
MILYRKTLIDGIKFKRNVQHSDICGIVDQSLFKLSFHHSNSRRIGNYNMTVSTKNIDIIFNVSDKVIGP